MMMLGNQLHGHVPDRFYNATIQFTNLTMRGNTLTGSIPDWIQRHSFLELDLANNRLDGTLLSSFQVNPLQAYLGLAVNRLSGDLPSTIRDAPSNMSMDVLTGNIFQCENDQLPSQDPATNSYSCGSYELNVAAYTWLGFVVSVAMILASTVIIFQRFPNLITWFNSLRWLYHSIISWYTAGCGLLRGPSPPLVTTLSNCVDVVDRLSEIPATIAFLATLQSLASLVIGVGIVWISIALPVNLILHSCSNAIVSYDYAYITSMAYLHGMAPYLLLATVLIIVSLCIIVFCDAFMRFIDQLCFRHQWKYSPSSDSTISSLMKSSLWPRFSLATTDATSTSQSQELSKTFPNAFLLISVNLINLIVVMVVNIAYVDALVNTSYTQSDLLAIQVFVGLFKTVWNTTYVVWSCDWLTSFLSHHSSVNSRYRMSIINYIIAPVISTIIYSKSCFYYVFQSADPIISSFSLTFFGLHNCVVASCEVNETIPVDSESLLAFDYSYACGAALIVIYTPVIFSSSLFYGVFQPILRILLAYDNIISRCYYSFRIWRQKCKKAFLSSKKKTSSRDPLSMRVRGRDIVVRLMVHLTVLLTFGYASPILAFPIILAMLTDIIVTKIFIGKAIIDNDIVVQKLQLAIVKNPIVVEIEKDGAYSATAAAVDKNANAPQPRFEVKADLKTIEELDMKSAHKVIAICVFPMIVFVILFWAFLFFDMIADVEGVLAGGIAMLVFAAASIMILLSLTVYLDRLRLYFPTFEAWLARSMRRCSGVDQELFDRILIADTGIASQSAISEEQRRISGDIELEAVIVVPAEAAASDEDRTLSNFSSG
jgi:hypothetical protein